MSMLIFDANPPYLRWCVAQDDTYKEYSTEFREAWMDEVARSTAGLGAVTAVGYLFYNCGGQITESVGDLDGSSLKAIEQGMKILPEYNNLMLKTARQLSAKIPDARHLFFNDTAFFLSMPKEASTYALPHELVKTGVRRYGGYGLCHEWVDRQVRSAARCPAERLVSVYLGDMTNIAALRSGKAVETTIGFTPLEGIPSSRSCGDLDPTILFQLHSLGMSFDELKQMLAAKSGFTGLAGKECTYRDLVQASCDPESSLIRELFIHHVLEYTGAFIAVLGGVDALAFTSDDAAGSDEMIRLLCSRLSFLGLKLAPSTDQGGALPLRISADDSKIKVFSLVCNKWKIMHEKATMFLGGKS